MNFKQFYLIEDLQSKMVILQKMYRELSPEEAKDRIELVNQADPTGTAGTYTQWLIKQDVSKKSIFPEDIDKLKEVLTTFDKIKKLNIPIKKDINQYKDFSELAKATDPYKEDTSKEVIYRKDIKEGYEVVFKDSTFEVLKVTTPEASVKLCSIYKNDNWCTRDIGPAENYLKEGPLYIFLKQGKAFVQAHVNTQQVMDFYDDPVSKTVFNEIYHILNKLNLMFFKYKPEDILTLKGKTWDGDLDLEKTKITSLPEGLKVTGFLDLTGTSIISLPEGLEVGGNLFLTDTKKITSLPKGLKVGGSIDLNGTKITSLPEDLEVNGGLNLSYSNITSLPEGFKVNGSLDLEGTDLTSIPDGIEVRGNLDLNMSRITILPKGLKVRKDLIISNTKINSLPIDLEVGGEILYPYGYTGNRI